jgi:hypothetical protein
MLDLWLDGIARLIAETTPPNVPLRLGAGSVDSVLQDHIAWDHWQSVEDAILHMPYWVVREAECNWSHYNIPDLRAGGAIEVRYFEHARPYTNLESLTERHRESKRYFLAHCSAVIESCAARQGRGSNVPLDRIELVIPASRSPIGAHDADTPETDYWQMAWAFYFGA